MYALVIKVKTKTDYQGEAIIYGINITYNIQQVFKKSLKPLTGLQIKGCKTAVYNKPSTILIMA